MFKKLLCLLWLTITPLSSHADLASPIDVKDPTQPPTIPTLDVPADQINEATQLTAIWIKATSRWVTINHIQAQQGDTIHGDIKILKILKNEVTITQNGTTKILRLLPSPYKIK